MRDTLTARGPANKRKFTPNSFSINAGEAILTYAHGMRYDLLKLHASISPCHAPAASLLCALLLSSCTKIAAYDGETIASRLTDYRTGPSALPDGPFASAVAFSMPSFASREAGLQFPGSDAPPDDAEKLFGFLSSGARLEVADDVLRPGYSRVDLLDGNAAYPARHAYEGGFVRETLSDARALALAPAHWGRREWLTAGAVVVVTGFAGVHDQSLYRTYENYHSATGDRLSRFGNRLGDGFYTLPLLGGFYAYGKFAHDERAYDTARMGFETFLLSGLVTTAGKHLIGRGRPDAANDPDCFRCHGASFPSGHVTSAFALATVFARQYPDHPWVAPVAYSLATLTALSRLYVGVHWTSDVIAGAAVGYFTGRLITGRHGNTEWEVRPTVGGGVRGASLTLRW